MLQARQALQVMFSYMDTNDDGRLFLPELAGWLMAIVQHHYDTATKNATEEFKRISELVSSRSAIESCL